MLQRQEEESVFCLCPRSAAVRWVMTFVRGGTAPIFAAYSSMLCYLFFLEVLGRKLVWFMVFHSQISQRCYMIMFSVSASSPQPAVIMWIMSYSWTLARNQIHAPFSWWICFHHDPCLWQEFGSWPIKLYLKLNYPLQRKRGILSLD